MEILRAASRIVAMKGKKIAEFHPTECAEAVESALELTLGPTGNLRAPTIVQGETVLIGFNKEVYEDILS